MASPNTGKLISVIVKTQQPSLSLSVFIALILLFSLIWAENLTLIFMYFNVNAKRCIKLGLRDILHAIVMCISSVKPVLWFVINLHQLFSNGAAFNTQTVDHWQATQFTLRITDEPPAILSVILRSLSVNYGSVYYMPLHLKTADGDLLIITEPALLRRCTWQSYAIYRAAPTSNLSVSLCLTGARRCVSWVEGWPVLRGSW